MIELFNKKQYVILMNYKVYYHIGRGSLGLTYVCNLYLVYFENKLRNS